MNTLQVNNNEYPFNYKWTDIKDFNSSILPTFIKRMYRVRQMEELWLLNAKEKDKELTLEITSRIKSKNIGNTLINSKDIRMLQREKESNIDLINKCIKNINYLDIRIANAETEKQEWLANKKNLNNNK